MQTGQPSRQPGAHIATFGPSRLYFGMLYMLAAMFIGIGVFVLWMRAQAAAGSINFTGDPTVLLEGAAGLIAAGGVALMVAWRLKRRLCTIHLHENALRAVGRGRDQLDYFADIEDVYAVSNGLFGWRVAPGTPWVIVDNRVAHFAKLNRELTTRQVAQRGEVLWNRLQAGGEVVFHLFPAGAAHDQIWTWSRSVDHPVSPVVLTASSLTIEGKTVPIAQLRPIDRSIWHEKIRFETVDGTAVCKTVSNAVLSLELLLTLVEELQRPAG